MGHLNLLIGIRSVISKKILDLNKRKIMWMVICDNSIRFG